MKVSDCIFCDIVAGKAPCYKIYEDKGYFAFLDIFPVVKGQVLVIPKKHINSNFAETDDTELSKFILAVKKVANQMRKKLRAERVNLIFEGIDVNHLHAKLYPDYINSSLGDRASDSVLTEMQKRLVE